tara:strand:+ start:237 stop:890 length:654 start_codon:yes stop_codon:yes gene_type:complete
MKISSLDFNKRQKTSIPEVIFCYNKSPSEIISIIREFKKRKKFFFGTKLSSEKYSKINTEIKNLNYHEQSSTFTSKIIRKKLNKCVSIITAGTSDNSVAFEALKTLNFFGYDADLFLDIGVSSIKRLNKNIKKINKNNYIIAIAGMDAAIATVLGGMTTKPIVAVPTSVGYGSSLKGLSALLSMLNSCSPGISIVNIDNGFGAACFIHKIINNSNEK